MAITFLQMAQKVLEDVQQPLSASEIWEVAVSKEYNKLVETSGKTPWDTLSALIYVDVRDNPASLFISIGARPKRFLLKVQADSFQKSQDLTQTPQLPGKKLGFHEKDLHPLMVYFGFYYLKAFLKTIEHNKSQKKNFNEWLHPDIVGCYYPFSDWEDEVIELNNITGNTAIKLYSFELKRELTLSNLRESFFQTVSNSSWANEGYLVAAEIDTDNDFVSELKRLSTAFGIGIIRLDISDPDSCEIVMPAKGKETVDWDTVNKIASVNPDFRYYIKGIQNDLRSKEVIKERYDLVLNKDEMIRAFSKKQGTS